MSEAPLLLGFFVWTGAGEQSWRPDRVTNDLVYSGGNSCGPAFTLLPLRLLFYYGVRDLFGESLAIDFFVSLLGVEWLPVSVERAVAAFWAERVRICLIGVEWCEDFNEIKEVLLGISNE